MLSSKLLNKIKRFANKFSREAREAREQIQNKAKEIVNQYKKKLAYFCQELTLMMPRVELKNLFGMDLARVMLLVAVLMTLPNVCTYAQGVPATTGSTNNDGKGIDVKSVAGKAFDTVYYNYLSIAGRGFVMFYSSEPTIKLS